MSSKRPSPFLDVLPIVATYFSISVAFGISVREAGLSLFAGALMSTVVFAGASQMIALGLIAARESVTAIVITTFVMNLRHLLMATALTLNVRHWPKRLKILLGLELTDESFALLTTRFGTDPIPPSYAFVVQPAAQISWIAGTISGYLLSEMIVDIKKFGLDYALMAMLLSLLALQARTRPKMLVALVSGAAAIFITMAGAPRASILIATAIGASVGLWMEGKWTQKPSLS